jgi:hypothetical protein
MVIGPRFPADPLAQAIPVTISDVTPRRQFGSAGQFGNDSSYG